MMGTGEIIYEKVHASPRLHPKISFIDNWMKVEKRERRVSSKQQSDSSVQEIDNVPNLTAKAPVKEQGDLFSNCVPVSVER